MAIGFLGVLQNVLVLAVSHSENRARLTGGLHAQYALASLLAPALVVALASFNSSFRWPLALSAVLGAGLLLLSVPFSHFVEPPTHKTQKSPRSSKSFWSMFFLGLALGSYAASEVLLSTRLTAYLLERSTEISSASARWHVTLFFVCLLVGRVLLFFVPEVKNGGRWIFGCLVGALIFFAAGLWGNTLFFGLVGLLMGPVYPLFVSLIGRSFPHDLQKSTQVAVVLCGLVVVLGHFALGFLSDRWGLVSSYAFVSVMIFISLFCLVWWSFRFQASASFEEPLS